MFSGEWEKGNLKSATEVEIRCISRTETNEGNSVVKYCLKNEWRYGWFINDEFEGMFNTQINKISDGDTDTSEVSFIGNLEINRAALTREIEVGLSEGLSSKDLNFIEGKLYYSAGGVEAIFDGEFRDNEPYNGTAHGSADGESIDYHVKNGERVD